MEHTFQQIFIKFISIWFTFVAMFWVSVLPLVVTVTEWTNSTGLFIDGVFWQLFFLESERKFLLHLKLLSMEIDVIQILYYTMDNEKEIIRFEYLTS